MATARLGIDLGTTRTVVACADRGNYPVVGFVDEAGDLCEWFPSLVAERAGELRYGLAARAVADDPSWTVVRSFKRWLGASGATPTMRVQVGGTELPVAQLLGGFVAALVAALRDGSNVPAPADAVLHAVIGVPAGAPGTQRLLMLEAFRAAGVIVDGVLNEPSAAAFEYTHRHRRTLSSRRDRLVVYDLGGGTFDASLVHITERTHAVLTSAGINQLGGDDFDEALLALVLAEAALPAPLPAPARRALRERCRLAKEAMTPQTRKLTLDLELDDAAAPRQVTVTAAAYAEACAALVARTLEVTDRVMAYDAADGAEPPAAIAGLYVVGGGSGLPQIARLLRERYGRLVHRSPYGFAATAIGLAIAADPDAGFALHDRFARVFGVFREREAGHQVSFDPILTPDMPLPTADAPLALTRRYRAAHNLGHFRFAECSHLTPDGAPGDLLPFADARFPFDPALRGADVDLALVPVERRADADGPLIEERYSIDARGLVEVRVEDLATGFGRTFSLGQRNA